MVATRDPIFRKKPVVNIPKTMIYEIMDGKAVYYKGYRKVLDGHKKLDDIMGASTLQALIVTHIVMLLAKLDEDSYTVLSSEAGLHLDKYNNLAGDILIFDNETLPVSAANEFYADVTPKIAIEIDIKADVEDQSPDNYIFKKTQKLLNFGVEKVIWITTSTKKVLIATKQQDWLIKDWNQDIEIVDGLTFNIGRYLQKRNSPFA